jgi:hypothetical protein
MKSFSPPSTHSSTQTPIPSRSSSTCPTGPVRCDLSVVMSCKLFESLFIFSRVDLPLTSQQIRNLINARLGHGNAEERLKGILSKFVEADGHTCLLVQDEWGLTCGIVLQNSAQKELFQRWGETLVLDWTHNTNNLGFYLGELRNLPHPLVRIWRYR